MKKLIFILMLLWGGGAAGLWYWNEGQTARVFYRTIEIKRGDLRATINATGTLEPEEVVDVGAQIAGAIQNFGQDPAHPSRAVSYGTLVEQGTVLAKLDDSLFRSRVNQAEANVTKAEADVAQAQVKVKHTERELERVNRLWKTHSISPQEHDTAIFDADSAKANLAVAISSVALSKANLDEAKVNLGYTTIRSPVKGVVVDRRVNIGQTVVASLNAPSLFLIAKDLSRMQIWASVNESDVGAIHAGQKVRFTVSAYPDTTFEGKVAQIRLNASMSQSVVTYTVVVDVENTSGKLLPYLTARLQFEVEERRGVLQVPNSALRWMPTMHQVALAYRSDFSALLRTRSASTDKSGAKLEKGRVTRGTLWVKEDMFVRPISVSVGVSDGVSSEIVGDGMKEGLAVVYGLAAAEGEDPGTSPFLPSIKNGKKK